MMCFNYASASALASIPTSKVIQGKMLGIGMEPIHCFCISANKMFDANV